MPRSLRYTDDAIADLEAITRWLSQTGAGRSARRRLTAISQTIDRLRQLPCLYPSADHIGVREMPCRGGYRVLYRVDPDTGRNDDAGDVLILKIYGPGQSREAFGVTSE